jgi:protease I
MNKLRFVVSGLLLPFALAGCAQATSPATEPAVEVGTATFPAPTSPLVVEPTLPSVPTTTPTRMPPMQEPKPASWEPQRPGKPCNPSETRTCAILYIFTDQYEDEHVLKTGPNFERAGYKTFVASNTLEEIRGFHECYGFTPANPDLLLEDVDVADYDAIVFVGSDGYVTELHNDRDAHRIARDAMEQGKVVAAIGDGPVLLARAGLLEGRTVTVLYNVSMYGIGDQWFNTIQRYGAIYTNRSPVRDGLLITADFASVELVWGIIEVLEELP